MDIAALNLEARSDSVKQATVDLKAMVPAASAAERAAQRWGMTTSAAARSAEDFSKRAQRVIRDLEFERQQLTRNAAEKQRYAALHRAGVAAYSAEGRAITAAVQALQAQRMASAASSAATKAQGEGAIFLGRALGPLAAAFVALKVAQAAWAAGMKAADFGEQAEQIGVTTDQLQAYRFVGAQAGTQTEQMDTAITKLAKTMGAANDGGKEQIELFQKLGVKLLDAQGELRGVAEVLPEVARGVLAIGSSSERTATLMELFGRSGAKMTTVLEEFAQGNDTVIAKARAAGVVLDTEVIRAWDNVSDSLTQAKLAADSTFAKLGAPIATSALEAVEKLLKSINGVMDQINSKEGFWASVLEESRSKGRIGSGPNALRLETPAEAQARRQAELEAELKNPNNAGREAMIQEDLARLRAKDVVSGGFYGEDMSGAALKGARAPATNPGGASDPRVKATGSDPYAKAIESGRQYIATKNAETAALGLSAEAAARMKHEQDLLNKVTADGRTVTDAQRQALKDLAQDMAAADNALATGKFMGDAKARSEEFIAQQQVERESIFLSTEAAARLRYENEMLNLAKQQGITLTSEQTQAIRDYAGEMASAEARTNGLRDAVAFAKDTAKGFFTDLRQGLQEGQSIWDAFANAGLNALNKIADKLFEMAIDGLINQLFSGLSGMGGMGGMGGGFGGFGGIFNLISGFFADGAAFRNGAVVPFARGGAFLNGAAYHSAEQRFAAGGSIVNRPTTFPMAGGRRGLMGEAGPEAIVPLHRGSDGGLGIRMTGRRPAPTSGEGGPVTIHQTIQQTVQVGSVVSRAEHERDLAEVEQRARKGAIAGMIEARRTSSSVRAAFKN